MGLELARELGVTMIGRAKGERFMVFNGAERVILDAIPKSGPRGHRGEPPRD
jgi:FdhD protein